MTEAISYMGNMFGVGSNSFVDSLFIEILMMGLFVIIISCFLSTPIYKLILQKLKEKNLYFEIICRTIVTTVVFTISLIEVVASTYNPFIYFNF